ncbi:MAG: hypothetical protein ACYSWP_19105 [Planctomycetota bacterium]
MIDKITVVKKTRLKGWPQEKPISTTYKSVAISIFGAMVVVSLLNLLANWYLKDYTFNRGYWIITQKTKILSSLDTSEYWLVLGDSSGNFGIVPEILDQSLNVRSINLCTIADMLTIGDSFTLRDYIEGHGTPTGVLMVYAYNTWPRKGKIGAFARSHWPMLKIKKQLELDASGLIQLAIHRFFPIYSESTTLTSMSLMPRTAFLEGIPFKIEPNGFMPLPEPSPGVLSDARHHLRQINEIEPVISSANLAGLMEIANLADDYGFNGYLVSSPLYAEIWQDPKFRLYFSTIQTKIETIASEYDRLFYLHFDTDLTFPADKMENVDHVILPAAKVYTSRVAERILEIDRQSAPPRAKTF